MGLLGKLTKLVIQTATLPFDIAKDVATLGGAITDEESAIEMKLKKLKKGVDNLDKN